MSSSIFQEIINITIRSVVSIVVLFVLTRIMGKKQMAQLTFFDYIVGISIGSISGQFASDDSISYVHGIIAIIVYSVFPILEYYIGLKSIRVREFLGGSPVILIQGGKIIEKNLNKSKLHINDLLEECRFNGAFSISEVQYAILETSGKVSIQLKPNKQPVTIEDMKIKSKYIGIAADLIIEGKILNNNLALVNKDKNWLSNELKKKNIKSAKEVLLATLDGAGNLYIDLRNQDPKPLNVLH